MPCWIPLSQQILVYLICSILPDILPPHAFGCFFLTCGKGQFNLLSFSRQGEFTEEEKPSIYLKALLVASEKVLCLFSSVVWLWIVGVVLDICHYRHSVSLFAWLKNQVDTSLSLKKLPIPKGVLFKLLFSLKIIFPPKSLSVDGCFKVTCVAFQEQEPKVRLWI